MQHGVGFLTGQTELWSTTNDNGLGGGGHVGLPLSIAFADKGQKVIIADKNKTALDTIASGRMPMVRAASNSSHSRRSRPSIPRCSSG